MTTLYLFTTTRALLATTLALPTTAVALCQAAPYLLRTALHQIGVTRAFQQQWAPAVEQLNRAIEMDSGLAYAYYYRGLAAEKVGRKDLLINDLERFLALAPNAPEAERARAVLNAARR
jgi:regulator of sirC expression with transglutaminase-like and TPR domain